MAKARLTNRAATEIAATLAKVAPHKGRAGALEQAAFERLFQGVAAIVRHCRDTTEMSRRRAQADASAAHALVTVCGDQGAFSRCVEALSLAVIQACESEGEAALQLVAATQRSYLPTLRAAALAFA